MIRGRAVAGVWLLVVLGARPPELGAQAAPPTPPVAPGTVSGVVVDKSSGDPIIEAGVEVVDHGTKATTDLDGRFKITLPPGTYQLRIFAPLYQPLRLEGVTVKGGEVTKQNASLVAAKGSVQVVEVVAKAERAAEATQLLERKKAAVVEDTISAQVIAKSPDKDAAAVVQRAPAVTIKDGKFIFVRGLGERYSSALLDGSRLPSTDPSKRVVPLDLFPAEFLESLGIIKSYTPDLPGDFSGGLVDIRLREFPERFTLTGSLSTSGNTDTTFHRFRTYPGGSLDYLGFGSNARKLPERVPDTVTFNKLDEVQRDAIGRSFSNIWSPQSTIAPVNTGFGFATGNTWGKFGATLAGLYRTDYYTGAGSNAHLVSGGASQPLQQVSFFRDNESRFATRLGGLFTATYKLTDTDKLTFRSLVDRNTYDNVLELNGHIVQNIPEHNSVLRYTEEELDFGQLAGEHRWSQLWLDWRTAFSRSIQNEPDTRYITYINKRPIYTDDSLGGTRIFNDLQETLSDSAADFTIPFNTGVPSESIWSGLPAKFKFGPSYSYRPRTFRQRRFVYDLNKAAFDLTQPPETILDPSNVVPGVIDFHENTQAGDAYDVSQEIMGAYGMFDLPLVRDRLRLIAGVREEYSNIVLKTAALGAGTVKIIKKDVDPLPGANLVFSPREDMNFRFAYSRSVSRPEFRELAPTQFPQPRGGTPLIGNPKLVETHLENWDARWEWFFSPLELVSLSFFHKTLDKPIERTVIAESSNIASSWTNAKNADLTGFEFEGRKDFGFITPRLQYLSLQANVAYIESTATIPRTSKLQIQSSTSRALQGQAPYIANAVLDYTHPVWGSYRLLYNTAGPTVALSGVLPLKVDVEQQPRHRLDAVGIVPLALIGLPKFTAKLSLENLFDEDLIFTQGDRIWSTNFTPDNEVVFNGIKVGLALQYSF